VLEAMWRGSESLGWRVVRDVLYCVCDECGQMAPNFLRALHVYFVAMFVLFVSLNCFIYFTNFSWFLLGLVNYNCNNPYSRCKASLSLSFSLSKQNDDNIALILVEISALNKPFQIDPLKIATIYLECNITNDNKAGGDLRQGVRWR
jgi:hypothetical protein